MISVANSRALNRANFWRPCGDTGESECTSSTTQYRRPGRLQLLAPNHTAGSNTVTSGETVRDCSWPQWILVLVPFVIVRFHNTVAQHTHTHTTSNKYTQTAVCLCINHEYSSWRIETENYKQNKQFICNKTGGVYNVCIMCVVCNTRVCFSPGCVWPSTRG